MRRLLPLVLLLSTTLPVPIRAQESRGDAWLDASAAALVQGARARRNMVDRRIERYQATAVERMSIRLRTGIGERLLFRRETASRIDWTIDTVRIEVLGAREVVPPVAGAPHVPAGLSRYMPALAFDPVDSEMLLRIDSTSIRHPLAPGSEEHYRFRTGDSTVIRLPNGRVVRLRELQILARRREPTLITGSFWLDMDTHAVVQAYFRLARAYDADRDDEGGGPPFLRPVRAELDYIAIDYGLWDLHWWLPRSVAAAGLFQAGRIRLPLSFERLYDDYIVTGDTLAAAFAADSAARVERPCRPRVSFIVQVGTTRDDSARVRAAAEREQARREQARRERAEAGEPPDSTPACDRAFIVTERPDAELLASELLPAADIYDGGTLLDADELRRIAERVSAIPTPPWQIHGAVQWPFNGPDLVRYNRVEGLSLGARALLDFGGASADAQLHVATAIPDVFAEAGVDRTGQWMHARLAGYRRLDVADIAARPLTFNSSLGALLLGRDEHDYFRATGAELLFRPPEIRTQWYDLRLFAESQRAVGVNSDFSIPHLIDDSRDFRPNIAADRAEQLGAELRLRAAGGLDPRGFRWGTELGLHGETGDYRFVRPMLRVRASAPVLRRLTVGAEGAAGTAFGDVPAQRLWQLGGASTLRGYDAAVLRGETFWRARAELGLGVTFAQFTLFGDAAWAGLRDDFERSRPLRSVGAGLSFLDGLVRFDLARGLDAPRGWKLHMLVGLQ